MTKEESRYRRRTSKALKKHSSLAPFFPRRQLEVVEFGNLCPEMVAVMREVVEYELARIGTAVLSDININRLANALHMTLQSLARSGKHKGEWVVSIGARSFTCVARRMLHLRHPVTFLNIVLAYV